MTLCLGQRSHSIHFTMEVILQGWLVKSPPENRTHGPLKLFRAKWRKRYFVLYQPPAADSLPGPHAELNYYSDETLKKKVGSIDLSHCEEVLSSLDSSHYKHLFALRTKHRNTDRTYYLAANTEYEMNKWVNSMCWVLGLMENDDQRSPSATPRQVSPAITTPPRTSPGSSLSQPSPLSSVARDSPGPYNSPGSSSVSGSSRSIPTEPLPPPPNTESQDSYIPLDQCVSGPSGGKKTSSPSSPSSPLDQVPPAPGRHRNSIPDLAPPPPPAKGGRPGDTAGTEHSMVYDHPSRSYVNREVLEKHGSGFPMEVYDYPARSNQEKLDANENFYKHQQQQQQQDDGIYDVPPIHPEDEDVYNVPPTSHGRVLPASQTFEDDGVYRSPPQRTTVLDEQVYNVPPPPTTVVGSQPHPSSGFEYVYQRPPHPSAVSGNLLQNRPPPPRTVGADNVYNQPPPPVPVTDSVYQTPPPPTALTDNVYSVPPPPTSVADSVYNTPPPQGSRPMYNTQGGDRRPQPPRLEEDSYRNVYQMPPPRAQPVEVVPRRTEGRAAQPLSQTDSIYTVPPPPKALSPETDTRDSTSSNGSHVAVTDSGFESGDRELYDSPRRPTDSKSLDGLAGQVQSTSIGGQWPAQRKAISEDNLLESVPPPPRPPKSDASHPTRDSRYMNLPSNGNGNANANASLYYERDRASTLPSSKAMVDDSWYDFPAPQQQQQQQQQHVQISDTQKMAMTPPPPHACPGKRHRYVNAPAGYASEPDNIYMPMAGMQGEEEEFYLPMRQPGNKPPQAQAASATDLEDMYVVPPARSVSRSCSDVVPPPKLQPAWKRKLMAGEEPPETYAIFPTQRTRSFKRKVDILQEVQLPVRRGAPSVDSSSDDDDDDDTYSMGTDRSVESLRQSAQPPGKLPLKGLHSTPPAPKRPGEVQYLDLELERQEDEDSEKSPVFTKPVQPGGTTTPTDYKEIDFVKTKALSETKKDVENKRKSSEKSMDE